MAFPNDPPAFDEFLDMEGCKPDDLDRWRRDMKRFVQSLTLQKQGKRLIMKSPPHTGRIAELAKLFPGASSSTSCAIPYDIFPSTRRLWVSLDWAQGFQHPHYKNLDEYVFHAFERMYRGFHKQCGAIPANQLCQLKYEDLERDPMASSANLRAARIGRFRNGSSQIEAIVGGQKDYKKNQHELEPELRSEIRRRWSDYFERYGYE